MEKKINFGVMTAYKGSIENNFKQAAELGLDSMMLTAMVTNDLKKQMIEKAPKSRQ